MFIVFLGIALYKNLIDMLSIKEFSETFDTIFTLLKLETKKIEYSQQPILIINYMEHPISH